MEDLAAAEVGYGGLVSETGWSPEPEGEEREGFNLRLPKSLLAKVRAAAEVESKVWRIQGRHGDVSVNGLMVFALKRYFADYEKVHGELPPPTSAKKGRDGKPVELSAGTDRYAASVAKKRQSRDS